MTLSSCVFYTYRKLWHQLVGIFFQDTHGMPSGSTITSGCRCQEEDSLPVTDWTCPLFSHMRPLAVIATLTFSAMLNFTPSWQGVESREKAFHCTVV